MFTPPPVIDTQVFTRVPDAMRVTQRQSAWGGGRDCYLEGPSFDRQGHLYCVDIPYGRVFRISPEGEFSIVAQYDGEPNGLKIHKDGQIFITDHKTGLMQLDPSTGQVHVVLDRPFLERFKGLNDLVFSRAGDLYFTDQGESGLQDPTGRLFRLRTSGRLDLLLDNVPSPNGLVLTPQEDALYLAVTRGNCIWRVPLRPDGSVGRVGVFIQLSGGIGPDGLASDEAGNLAIAHFGFGAVWLFSPKGEPLYRIESCMQLATTNLAYGGPGRKTLYITESNSGTILKTEVPVPGAVMYSHT